MTEGGTTAYEPDALEERWYESWEDQGLFSAHADSDKPSYCIVIPPPNVTGALHMGHALNSTMQDILIRRARMQGREALWLPGTDHAGIATQNVVERELAKQGIDREALGRDAFIERVWEWKAQYGGRIIEQLRRLGCSCDWERERFTFDDGLSRAVRTVFVKWFEDGFIYRGFRIINWCPRCTTALSDIEVEHEDVDGEIVTFRYALRDGSGDIAVATTRIETMLGDTGIAVHPDDERYKDLIGKEVIHPFYADRKVPIVADDAVDSEFGTGAVKVTPAHDSTDFEIAGRTNLVEVNIFDKHAHTNDAAGEFSGLDRYEARKVVLAKLQELGVVDNVERPYRHAVGHCYRCGTEIEPWLSEQWFVKMKPLAEPAIDAVADARIVISPPRFKKAYLDWLDNIRDWCISRQIWWGHRIPVWYCDDCGEVFASLEDPSACRKCDSHSITQDPDVLDTWFSSQLWPFSTLGWPDDTADLKAFYPTSVMVTAYEILYLWVARMVISGLYFMDDVPFKDVFIHGIVRDFEGKKMSKSIGNVIDPLDMVDAYGADALRFALARVAVPGNDTNVSEERIEGSRNFANKLWNAARFVLMSVEESRPPLPPVEERTLADRWILSRLEATGAEADAAIDGFGMSVAAKSLYAFIWGDYCDWYIELAKLELSGSRAEATKGVLIHVLDQILRLLHPFMPFVTEELWARLRPEGGSIMVAPWPQADGVRDEAAEDALERFRDLVQSLRRLRNDHGIEQGIKMPVVVAAGAWTDELQELSSGTVALARLASVDLVDVLPPEAGTARTITSAGIEASVNLGDVVDLDVEKSRLERKLADARAEVARAEKKLANDQFVRKAPEDVVEAERQKLRDAQANEAKIEAQIVTLPG